MSAVMIEEIMDHRNRAPGPPPPPTILQVHGISAAGPNQLLQNLHKLLAAAASALPQGLLR